MIPDSSFEDSYIGEEKGRSDLKHGTSSRTTA
jgi:hypothetical protein